MKFLIQKVITWLSESLNNDDHGPSLKKLIAVGFFLMVVSIHIAFCRSETFETSFEFDLFMILALLGVATWDKLQTNKIKNGGTVP